MSEIVLVDRVLVNAGLTLPVVPELDTLTIGGLLMGGGIESTSHKHGLFHRFLPVCIIFVLFDICYKLSYRLATAYQLVTATGDLLEVTEKSYPDIFHALPMSYGTLGFVVGVTMKVVTYRPYIRIEYHPTRSLEQTTNLLKQLTRYYL